MKKPLFILLMSVVGLICIAPVLFAGFLFGQLIYLDYQVKQSFILTDNVDKVYEDTARYGANSAQRSVYYWSDASIQNMQSFYDGHGIALTRSGDSYGEWWIGALTGETEDFRESSRVLGHPSYCSYQEQYSCVTVTLIAVDQQDFYRTGVMSPSSFRRSELPRELSSLPASGVLIIFSYYVIDY